MKKAVKMIVVCSMILAFVLQSIGLHAEARTSSSRSHSSSHSSSHSKSSSYSSSSKSITSSSSKSSKNTSSSKKTSNAKKTGVTNKLTTSKPKKHKEDIDADDIAELFETEDEYVDFDVQKTKGKKMMFPQTLKVTYEFPKGSALYGKNKYFAFDVSDEDVSTSAIKKKKKKFYVVKSDELEKGNKVSLKKEFSSYFRSKKRTGSFYMTFYNQDELNVFENQVEDENWVDFEDSLTKKKKKKKI